MTRHTTRRPPGSECFAAAVILTLLMAAATLWLMPSTHLEGELGICLPSPNTWHLPRIGSCVLNVALLIVVAAGATVLNKRYNFITGARWVLPSAFLVTAASQPWLLGTIGSPVIMAWATVLCLHLLFGGYGRPSSADRMFLLATVLSWGSMIQYAFLLTAPLYLAGALILKQLRLREILAFLLGLLAPYWIVLGLGIVSTAQLTLPTLTNLFSDFAPRGDVLMALLGAGLTALTTLVFGCNNALRLFTANSATRHYNYVLSLMAAGFAVLMACDFTNMLAYMTSFYLMAAVQTANFTSPAPSRATRPALALLAAAYVALFILSVYN